MTRRKPMTHISRLAVLAAVTAVAIPLPAFAQSSNPQFGAGVPLPFGFMTAPQNDIVEAGQSKHGRMARGRGGLNSFGALPGFAPNFDSDDPALTGGGSLGYNR